MPKYTQAATALNNVLKELSIGAKTQNGVVIPATVADDLSNLSDVGKPILDYVSAGSTNYDTVIRKLIDQVGQIWCDEREYTSQAADIMVDGWEYGTVMQKVRCKLPAARNNATWQLGDYAAAGSYPDPYEISLPDLAAKFYNDKDTYEVPITITEKQFEGAVQNAAQLQKLIGMIYNAIDTVMVLDNDALIEDNISKLIAGKLHYSSTNVVDLLTDYNTKTSQSLTAEAAMMDAGFLRYATTTMAKYKKYLAKASVKYNEGGFVTHTPPADLKMLVIADFAKDCEAYLYAGTYHDEFVKMSGYQEISCWNSSGTDADRMRIYTYLGYDLDGNKLSTPVLVDQDNVVAVMFDRRACMVTNEDYRVRSADNQRGEYINYFYKWDAGYFIDYYENCVVFVLGKDNAAEVKGTWAAGTAAGSTKFTLSASLPEGHSLKVNNNATAASVVVGAEFVASGADQYPTGTWSSYTSGSNITSATTSKTVTIIEVDGNSKIVSMVQHKPTSSEIGT